MATVVLITEDIPADAGFGMVHQLHTSILNAVETIGLTHSTQPGVKIEVGARRLFKGVWRTPVSVTWAAGHNQPSMANYLLTELEILENPDHL